MNLKYLPVSLIAMMLSIPALAGLSEAITAYNISRYDQALAEFSYLSDEGNGTAAYYLGQMYEKGLGVSPDNNKAIYYYTIADASYNLDATYNLARILLENTQDTTSADFEKGIDYLKKAAYAGQSDALVQLGTIYEQGLTVKTNYQYAFGYYYLGALNGDAVAQYKLGMMYIQGVGIPQNFQNGLKWLTRSARQGYVVAQAKLADLRTTEPMLKNINEAYTWYNIIAAYNGEDEVGQNAMKKRDFLEKQIKKAPVLVERQRIASEWRPTAPEDSVPKSELLTATTPIIPGFNDGQSVQKMLDTGKVLLADGRQYGITNDMILQASITGDLSMIENAVKDVLDKGDAAVCAYYADLLIARFKNPEKAMIWYEKGAMNNDSYAQYQLAKNYCAGIGVDAAKPSLCYAWLQVANNSATDVLKLTIQSAMSTVQPLLTSEELTQSAELLKTFDLSKPKAKKESKITDLF